MPFLRPFPSKLSVAVAAGFVLAGCMTSSRIPAPVEHRDSAQAKGIIVEPGQAALESRQPGQADYRLAETPQTGVRGQWPQSRIAATDPNQQRGLRQPGQVAPLIANDSAAAGAPTGTQVVPSAQATQRVAPPGLPTITRETVTPSAQATVQRAPTQPAAPAITPSESAKVATAGSADSATGAKQSSQRRPVASGANQPAQKAATNSASTDTQKLATASKPADTKAADATGKSAAKTKGGTAPAVKDLAAGNTKFIWPAHGALVQKFADKKSMGIGISGRAGDRVNATADGEVIFSGLGPRGYGKLLIVKHNPEILSVYAHNRSLLVKEGQAVRQGQKIAELGSTGTDRPKLHFEIRRQGKPVDPLAFLPSRK